METLELLEELLLEYQGTLLLVSHDREFLNNVVTSTLVLEGQGRVKEYAGGYDDWIAQRKPFAAVAPSKPTGKPKAKPKKQTKKSNKVPSQTGCVVGKNSTPAIQLPHTKKSQPRQRLTYGEKLELEKLPARIEKLEKRQTEIHDQMSAPAFFEQDRHVIAKATADLKAVEEELAKAFERWESLEKHSG